MDDVSMGPGQDVGDHRFSQRRLLSTPAHIRDERRSTARRTKPQFQWLVAAAGMVLRPIAGKYLFPPNLPGASKGNHRKRLHRERFPAFDRSTRRALA